MKKFAILSMMAVLALGACDDDDDPTGNAGEATVRVVNATSMPTGTANNFASINAFRGNTQIVGGVAAGTGSVCTQTFRVPAGQQTLNFRTQGSTTQHAQTNYTFVAGRRYTILFYGTNTSPRAMVIEDEATTTNATSGNRRFRFVNATTNATNFDVYARSTTTGSPTASTVTASNVGTGMAATSGGSMYFNIPTANTFFQVYNTGTTTTARTTHTLSTTDFPASGNATIVFTDNGSYQINNCS